MTTRVAGEIQQLIISPRHDYLAILTKHTVHIGVIPESSRLTEKIEKELKFRTFQLGPTTHVTTQSPIAAAVWHPLGVAGLCLVTVSTDANVRVWELSITDRLSFDRPTLSINLQKLADGVSQDQDFSASNAGLNRSVAFSPDSFEMEVASACFASKDSGGWSPMTLWVAMKEGDVYALCPLLPEKWSPPIELIPSLSTSVIANIAAIEDDHGVSHQKKQLAQQQLAWMSDIDAQDPTLVDGQDGEKDEVFLRPSKPGRIPKLQGPFEFDLAPPESEQEELDTMLTDIHVIGSKIDIDQELFGEDDYGEDNQGLSVGIICLTSRNGRLSILLDVAGVEAQWLPRTKPRVRYNDEDEDYPTLLTFQVLDTLRAEETSSSNWPVFSQGLDSNYSFYITNTNNVVFISLTSWVFRLETELSGGAAGSKFRIDLLTKNESSIREEVHRQKLVDYTNPLSAAVPIRDSDLGHFMLTCTAHGPITVVFEPPYEDSDDFPSRSFTRSPTYDDAENPLILYEPRPIYQPSYALSTPSSFPSFHASVKQKHSSLSAPVRLNPTTLTILTDAHKILSEETHRLGEAAAELFRRIEVLQAELKSKVEKANEVAQRVDEITGEDTEEDGPLKGANERITERLQAAKSRQEELAQRVDRLRRKVGRGSQRELSDREKAWFEEVSTLASKILPPKSPVSSIKDKDPFASLSTSLAQSSLTPQPYERFVEAQVLTNDLVQQAQEISGGTDSERSSVLGSSSGNVFGKQRLRVSRDVKNQEIEAIKEKLERQSEIVERTKERLERLINVMD